MHYSDLEKLQKTWQGKVCIFATGLIGSTWAYDLLKGAGFYINFFCDNNKKENTVIRDGIKTISLNMLYSFKDNVLVFIAAAGKYQTSIREQLKHNGISHLICVDHIFLQHFTESLLEINNLRLMEQFRCILDDKEYISRQFAYYLRYKPDLNKPKTFNEKLQWLKLHNRKPEYMQMVDKYEVKKFVTDKIGEEYVIPTLRLYNSFEEINFEELPKQFVLKCTHDSGSIVICKDKGSFDKDKAKEVLEYGMQRDFYWTGSREWPYKNIKPRIIAEKYMSDESNEELKDYKIFNFNGKAKLIQVDYDRFKIHKRNLYTTNWEYIEASIKYPNDPARKIKRPQKLEKMIELSEKLAEGIPHVRADFYSINDKIYFGELTFYHGGGYEKFRPVELDDKLGEMIEIWKV